MKKLFLTFTFITFCLLSVNAQSKTGTLTDMSFLEGHWRGTFNGGPIDAVWIAPAGDNLTGFIRMMKDNKVTMYEMLIFEQTDNGPIALVKHFKPGLIGQEEKDKQDRYRFLEANKKMGQSESSTKNGQKINWLFSEASLKMGSGLLATCLCSTLFATNRRL